MNDKFKTILKEMIWSDLGTVMDASINTWYMMPVLTPGT
jgi:hypothetical protein